VNGYVNDDDTPLTKCSVACNGKCCVGPGKYSYNGDYTNPCQSFTGKICMDGSCHGRGACFNGVIPTIVNSCNGTRACSGVAANKGKAGHFESSCVGDRVCEFAGASGFTAGVSSGAISNITKSCIGYRACYGAGVEKLFPAEKPVVKTKSK